MDTKNIFIHIGLPKTGTTTIQQGLKLNEFKLKRNGFLCPLTGRVNNKTTSNHNLSRGLMDHPLYTPENGTWDDLLEEINQEGQPENIIMTSERFSRLDVEKMKKVKAILTPHTVIIVCYLRRQDQWLQSLWSQITKNNRVDTDLKGRLEKVHYTHDLSDYYEVISNWASVFSKENIRLRLLERTQLKGHLFHDFLDTCGVENTSQYQIPENANVSPSMKTLEILIQIKKRIPKLIPLEELRAIEKLVRDFTESKGWNKERISLVDRDLYQKIMSIHEGSNTKLAREYFGRDDLFLEPFKEKVLTNYQIEDYDTPELIDLFLLTISSLLGSDRYHFWAEEDNGQNLNRENKKLKAEIDKIRSSLIWKVLARLRSLRGKVLRRI